MYKTCRGLFLSQAKQLGKYKNTVSEYMLIPSVFGSEL